MAVIVTDIFGVCDSTDEIALRLSRHLNNVRVVDPYEGARHDFSDEGEAYNAFSEVCGHDNYLSLLRDAISAGKTDLIIGFSAGASAAWRLAATKNINCKQIFCFYPGQIRNYLDVRPVLPVEVVFPHSEPSFDVAAVSQQIALLPHVNCEITPYRHGFMNKRSQAYNACGEQFGLGRIESYLSER